MNHLEPIQVLVTAAVVLAVLIAAMVWGSRRRQAPSPEKAEVWHEVTKRLGGKLYTQESDYRVRFTWNGRSAALFEGQPVVFEIAGWDFGKLRGTLDPQLPKPSPSDAPYEPQVSTSNRKIMEEFLTAPVRKLLRDLGHEFGAKVKIETRFWVSGRPAENVDCVVRFAMLCLQLAQHARLFAEQSSGVFVVETGSSPGGQCQICGAELEGKLVRCSRCSTPHHADCWEYAGKCSTYGCGEKQFVA